MLKDTMEQMGMLIPDIEWPEGVPHAVQEALRVYLSLVTHAVRATGVIGPDSNDDLSKDVWSVLITETFQAIGFEDDGGKYEKQRAAMNGLNLTDIYIVQEVAKNVIDYAISVQAKQLEAE